MSSEQSDDVAAALAKLEAAETDEERLAIEKKLVEQTDNRPTEFDPKDDE